MGGRAVARAFPTGDAGGLSVFEYYAAHAPEAPDWFVPKMRACPKPKPIPMLNDSGEEPRYVSYIEDLHAHGSYDMFVKANPTMTQYADKVLERRAEVQKWNEDYATECFFQWRRYYAKMMCERMY